MESSPLWSGLRGQKGTERRRGKEGPLERRIINRVVNNITIENMKTSHDTIIKEKMKAVIVVELVFEREEELYCRLAKIFILALLSSTI